ncbi:MAG: hypothetical protein KGJ63_01745 [Pseudomonadota bacterium]|nr:hypothetical protein [Pseudomonadota bacterium]
MKDMRFGWLGESRRAALCSSVCAEVAEWSREWWVHHASLGVDVQWAGHRRFVAQGPMPLVSINPAGSLGMFLGSNGLDRIGRHLAGADEDEDAGWAHRIGEEALADLAARICRRGGISKFSSLSESVSSHDLERTDLGSGVVAIALGELEWVLAMDRPLVDRLAPPRETRQSGLASRQSALDGAPLRVEAVIDFGSVNLTDLSDLRVGEILVGDRGLEEAMQLHLEGYGAVAMGYLRRMGTQRAVLLDGINSKEQHKP